MILSEFTVADLPRLRRYVDSDQALIDIEARMSIVEGTNVQAHVDGRLMAAGGLQLLHRGVAEAWLVLTPYARKHPRALSSAMRAWLDNRIHHFGLHRIQALVHPEKVDAIRLLLHLQMSYEGTLRQICQDRTDGQMYAWVAAKGGVND